MPPLGNKEIEPELTDTLHAIFVTVDDKTISIGLTDMVLVAVQPVVVPVTVYVVVVVKAGVVGFCIADNPPVHV